MNELNLLCRRSVRNGFVVIYESELKLVGSYTKQMTEILLAWFDASRTRLVKDTGGTSRTIPRSNVARAYLFHVAAGSGNADYGLVAGTGTDAESINNYQLKTKIAHGSGSGQLQYGIVTGSTPAVIGGNVDMTISRSLVNGSGNSITIREDGMYVRVKDFADASRYFCVIRELLDSPLTVNNGQTYTMQYTLRTTV